MPCEGCPKARDSRPVGTAQEEMMNDLAKYDSLPVERLRDKIMDDLVKQYALERVDLSEFERRTDLVSKAVSRGELVALIADLPPLPEDRPSGGRKPTARGSDRAETWSVSSDDARASDISISIFSGSDFKGVWRTPRRLNVLCIFGGTNIDLRRAIVPEDGLSITCVCAFGGADVIVPPGMRVLVRGVGIFGGFDRTSNEVDDPSAPTVVIEGIAVFGGVSVRVRA
jgi:hypothetical protein